VRCCSLRACAAECVAMYVTVRIIVCVFVLQCVAVSGLLIYPLHFASVGNSDPNLLLHPKCVSVYVAECATVRVAV